MKSSETSAHEETSSRKGLSETMTVLLILLAVVVLLGLWAASTVIWGIPGLYIPALALVLVSMVTLVVISRG
jgi:hypothetical protein